MKSDHEIARDVDAEPRRAPELDETDIAVKVTSGVVALTGFVHSFADKYNAEKAAKRINGVAAVANDLEVRLPSTHRLTDPEIARNVTMAVRSMLPSIHQNVKSLVHDGYVTLEGTVDWDFQREDIERAVRDQVGVKSVINSLLLRPRAVPEDIKRRIQSALMRNAQLDANQISVETQDGVITLQGKVHSWADREEAQRTAWAAPGVSQVSNEITVSAN